MSRNKSQHLNNSIEKEIIEIEEEFTLFHFQVQETDQIQSVLILVQIFLGDVHVGTWKMRVVFYILKDIFQKI